VHPCPPPTQDPVFPLPLKSLFKLRLAFRQDQAPSCPASLSPVCNPFGGPFFFPTSSAFQVPVPPNVPFGFSNLLTGDVQRFPPLSQSLSVFRRCCSEMSSGRVGASSMSERLTVIDFFSPFVPLLPIPPTHKHPTPQKNRPPPPHSPNPPPHPTPPPPTPPHPPSVLLYLNVRYAVLNS